VGKFDRSANAYFERDKCRFQHGLSPALCVDNVDALVTASFVVAMVNNLLHQL
jgi:hypothetical protein